MVRPLACVVFLLLGSDAAFSQILRPTTYFTTNIGFSNPTNAYDSNPGTYAGISFGRTCTEGAGTTRNGNTWYGFTPGFSPSRLFVKWDASGNANASGMTAKAKLEYSTNGGASWSTFPSQSFQAPPTFSSPVQYVDVALGSGVASEACRFGSSRRSLGLEPARS